MKVEKLKFSATIPVVQYGNIMPEVELSDVDHVEGTEFALEYIKDLFAKYSEKGALRENEDTVTVKVKSWNEDVEVEQGGHRYYYQGNRLVSATSWLKQYYKEFDAEMIAKACEKSWGVPAADILGMWDSNKTVSADLGTLVEAAIQHYDLYYSMGEKISAKNGKENPAMPKHPLLRGIVEEFQKLDHPQGEIVPQALLTDVGTLRMGLADRLVITGDKRCRIQDYKVNIDADKVDKNAKLLGVYAELPSTKLSKYQLQMSYYADLLKKSGWTVEGIDALVYEDCWKKYELEVVDII